MKALISVATLIIISVNTLYGQPTDFSAVCQEEMKKLEYFSGIWKGEATMQRGPGSAVKMMQEEKIEYQLDGTVLEIEGTGRDADGKIIFNALGLVNYDAVTKQFKFKSYLKEGQSTDAYFKVLEENKFEWGFDIPAGGKVKYTITLDSTQKTWYEKGEYTSDGNIWHLFIELKLKKI